MRAGAATGAGRGGRRESSRRGAGIERHSGRAPVIDPRRLTGRRAAQPDVRAAVAEGACRSTVREAIPPNRISIVREVIDARLPPLQECDHRG